jgi:hypothetical protein
MKQRPYRRLFRLLIFNSLLIGGTLFEGEAQTFQAANTFSAGYRFLPETFFLERVT